MNGKSGVCVVFEFMVCCVFKFSAENACLWNYFGLAGFNWLIWVKWRNFMRMHKLVGVGEFMRWVVLMKFILHLWVISYSVENILFMKHTLLIPISYPRETLFFKKFTSTWISINDTTFLYYQIFKKLYFQ